MKNADRQAMSKFGVLSAFNTKKSAIVKQIATMNRHNHSLIDILLLSTLLCFELPLSQLYNDANSNGKTIATFRIASP